MSEQRYTDEEVAAIFKQAAETDRTALPATGGSAGTTLADLQEIGREVGISPQAIAHAAQSIQTSGTPVARRFVGLPIAVGRAVEFERSLSDAEWEILVADLRQTFNATGRLRVDGAFRQWSNGSLQAMLEPTPAGQRLRIQTSNGNARGLMQVGFAALAVSGVTWLVATLTGTIAQNSSQAGIGFMAIAGVVTLVAGAVRVPGWARRRRAEIDEVIARVVNSRPTRAD